jgi:hypothetical protein
VRELLEEGQAGSASVESERVKVVKVFSATRARDREALGEAVTAWLANNRDLRVAKACVNLSSDDEFHCLSIVLFCSAV